MAAVYTGSKEIAGFVVVSLEVRFQHPPPCIFSATTLFTPLLVYIDLKTNLYRNLVDDINAEI